MRRIHRMAHLACLVLLLGCGGGRQQGVGSSPTEGQLTIVFENTQFDDATVYVRGAAGTRRLGRVSGTSTSRFRIPHTPTSFVIEASFPGMGDAETAEIRADPGDIITVTAQSTGNLVFSIGR